MFTKKKRSQVMAAIRSRGNKDTELKLAAILRAAGITAGAGTSHSPAAPISSSLARVTPCSLTAVSGMAARSMAASRAATVGTGSPNFATIGSATLPSN